MIDFQKYISQASYLSIQEFNSYFDICWNSMTKSFKKFECLQYYAEGPDSPMIDFFRKDIVSFAEKLLLFKETEKKFYETALKKNISLERLHLVRFPVTDYLCFEYYSYYISQDLGENIMIDNIDSYSNQKFYDFVLFDDSYLFIYDYDEQCKLKGCWYMTSERYSDLLKELSNFYNKIKQNSKPFQTMIKPDMKILNFIVQN